MKLDTQPLLIAAAHLALAGYLEREVLAELRTSITSLERQLASREEHAAAYVVSREQLALDGSELAWARWRAENLLLCIARADVERLQSRLRFEVERLEVEVARAQQRQARAQSGRKEARA